MPRRPTASRTRTDWIDAALDALASGGIGAVRVEAIARSIGVTKGSFYWHFADRPALVVAMRETWRDRVLDELRAVEPTGPVRAQVERLLGAIAGSGWRDHELGLRHHGRFDEATRAEVARVDTDRMAHLTSLFKFLGFDEADARSRCRVALAALAGMPPDGDVGALVDDLVQTLAEVPKPSKDTAAAKKKKDQLSLF